MSSPSPPPYEEEESESRPKQAVRRPLITTQPGAAAPGAVWIPLPAQIEGVPRGLEYLTMVDTIVIQQMYEFIELLTGWESRNKYSLKNANGQQVYYAAEESDCCERQCCRRQRGFDMHIVDNYKREVMRVTREFNCMAGCFCCQAMECWAHECFIESPPGNVIGSVKQRPGCVIKVAVNDARRNTIFHIDGPCCAMPCEPIYFVIYDMNGHEVGMITKKWRGCVSESFTDADVFCVTFPMDLDVRMKAILIGATFLIDFMAFEQ